MLFTLGRQELAARAHFCDDVRTMRARTSTSSLLCSLLLGCATAAAPAPAPAVAAESPERASPAPANRASREDVPPAQTHLSGKDLVAVDLPVLEQALRELHPGLLRYNNREQLDARLSSLRKAWSRDQTLAEAYLALSQFG